MPSSTYFTYACIALRQNNRNHQSKQRLRLQRARRHVPYVQGCQLADTQPIVAAKVATHALPAAFLNVPKLRSSAATPHPPFPPSFSHYRLYEVGCLSTSEKCEILDTLLRARLAQHFV